MTPLGTAAGPALAIEGIGDPSKREAVHAKLTGPSGDLLFVGVEPTPLHVLQLARWVEQKLSPERARGVRS